MPLIPLYFEAKQVSTILLTPQTVDCDGALTGVTADNVDVVALATFDLFTFQLDRGLFEYSPAHAQVANYQQGKIDFVARLSCFDKPRKVQALLDLYGEYDLIRIAARAGCPPAGATNPGNYFVVIGRFGDVGSGYREGRNTTEISIRPVGIEPQWAAAPTI